MHYTICHLVNKTVSLSSCSGSLFFFSKPRRTHIHTHTHVMKGPDDLAEFCKARNWEKAKAMIDKNPQWLCLARDDAYDYSPAFWATDNRNLEMLRYMTAALLVFSFRYQQEHHLEPHQQQQKHYRQMMQDAFGRPDDVYGWSPVHVAVECMDCLAFLLEHVPDGDNLLEAKSISGYTPAHSAAHYGDIHMVNYIVRHAPSGVGVLERTPRPNRIGFTAAVVKILCIAKNKQLPLSSHGSTCVNRSFEP